MYLTLLQYYGLRKEEALALRKCDFTIEKGRYVMHINNALYFHHNKPYLKETKTISSNRSFLIFTQHEEFIKEYLANCKEYLFTYTNSDQWISEQSFKRMFESIINKMTKKALELGIPAPKGLTSHILRHNYATSLYYAGVGIKDAQNLLGHSSSQVTLDVYTHIKKNETKATEQLEEYFKKQNNNQ